MRNIPNLRAERYRVCGPPRSNCGAFVVDGPGRAVLRVIAGDGLGWDHVSVSLNGRCPTWQEMCLVKELFFRDDECVMQLHPPKAEWIDCHPYTLHLWRPQTDEEIAEVRRRWQETGEPWPYGVASPGVIPRPPQKAV